MSDHPLLDAVRRALDRHTPHRVRLRPEWIPASVALVVRPTRDDLELLLIKRAERAGDPWSGHMALPGGRRQPEDAGAFATAVRETREEVGIDLAREGRLLGRLDDVSPLGARIPPIVISAFAFAVPAGTEPAPNYEVEAGFWIPLQTLLHPESRAEHLFELAGETPLRFPAFAYREYVIWGLTYRILTQFLQLTGISRGREL